MKKEIIAKCKKCGDVVISYFEGTDGEMSIPVKICPTIQSVAKCYKRLIGATYFKNTGNKITNSFEKRLIEPSHLNYEDDGYEIAKRHTLEPIECWVEIT